MFLQFLISGLTLGLGYAVVALGFQVVARAVSYRIPALIAVVLTVLAVTVVSWLLERLALAPVRVREPLMLAILTVGLATFLRGLMILVWGHDVLFAPPLLDGPW